MSSPVPRSRRGAHRTGRSLAAALMPSVLAVVAVAALITSLAVWRGEDPGQPGAAASTTSPTATSREAISQAPASTPATARRRSPGPRRRRLHRGRGQGHRRAELREVEVVVLNQTSRSGLAGSVADQLRGKGWTVPAVGNFRGIVPATTVYYPPAGGRRAGRSREPADVAADPAAVRQPVDVPAHRGRHRLVPGLTGVSALPEPSTEAGRTGLAALLADPAGALIGLDFDGTLAPIVPDPDAARGHPDVPDVLDPARDCRRPRRCGHRPAAGMAVEYGAIADVPGLVVLGHYGLERWEAGVLSAPEDLAAVEEVRRRAARRARRGRRPGRHVRRGQGRRCRRAHPADRRPAGRPRAGPRAARRPRGAGRPGRRAGPVRPRAPAGRRRQGGRGARRWSRRCRRPSWPSSATTWATSPRSTPSTACARPAPRGCWCAAARPR